MSVALKWRAIMKDYEEWSEGTHRDNIFKTQSCQLCYTNWMDSELAYACAQAREMKSLHTHRRPFGNIHKAVECT